MQDHPTIVGGRYRLGALIAASGMADVYAATDERLDRPGRRRAAKPHPDHGGGKDDDKATRKALDDQQKQVDEALDSCRA